ncbi:hypothetical protein CXU21_07335 [Akkermansia muciniphila]|nr:hypothetical protein CXU21_07335 [Akkermansia muciniphila]
MQGGSSACVFYCAFREIRMAGAVFVTETGGICNLRHALLCYIGNGMIHDLLVSGMTVFPGSEHFEFVPGINVVVGGNDSGKSHLLKLCYTVAKWSADGGRKSLPEKWAEEQRLRKDLMRVFASRGLAGLTARNRGNAHAHVEASMEGEGVPEGMGNLVFDFKAGHEEEGLTIQEMPLRFLNVPVVFLAAREVLTIYPSFVQVGSRFPEFLDGGSWDLCRYLDADAAAEPISTDAGRVVARLEKIIGGQVVKRDGRFFLQRPGQEPIEMSLVAEGFKRLGTLSYLIRNGSVKRGSVLFWDEPEMNLNASHLPVLVKTLTGLAKTGVQVILSSHSLFLLRELMIQLSEPRNAMVQRKFFGMSVPRGDRSGVRVSWGESLEDVGPIESLEAEIEQADRYLKLSYES